MNSEHFFNSWVNDTPPISHGLPISLNSTSHILFGADNPALYLVRDGTTVANFEGGYQHKYGKNVTNNGTVWNTNYYHLAAVSKDDVSISLSTKKRTEVLKNWLKTRPDKMRMGDVIRLLASHYNGPFNSINRELTVAKYMVRDTTGQASYLYVKETIPAQKYNAYHIKLSPGFFKNTPVGPLDNSQYGLLGSINQQKMKG